MHLDVSKIDDPSPQHVRMLFSHLVADTAASFADHRKLLQYGPPAACHRCPIRPRRFRRASGRSGRSPPRSRRGRGGCHAAYTGLASVSTWSRITQCRLSFGTRRPATSVPQARPKSVRRRRPARTRSAPRSAKRWPQPLMTCCRLGMAGQRVAMTDRNSQRGQPRLGSRRCHTPRRADGVDGFGGRIWG